MTHEYQLNERPIEDYVLTDQFDRAQELEELARDAALALRKPEGPAPPVFACIAMSRLKRGCVGAALSAATGGRLCVGKEPPLCVSSLYAFAGRVEVSGFALNAGKCSAL